MSTATLDVAALSRTRHARLQVQLAERDVAAAVLLHAPHVGYVTGLPPAGVDGSQAAFVSDVAVVVAGSPRPHLFSDRPDEVSGARLPVDTAGALWPELDEGAARLGSVLDDLVDPGAPIAVDALTGAMLRAGVPAGDDLVDAGRLIGAAKLVKTGDELRCIDQAQRHTELAMSDVRRRLRPGVRRRELVAVFLASLAEQGAGANLIDPIFQPMPLTIADGPRTTTGDVAFPVAQQDWTYAEGDLVWVDAGVAHLGYASDYGRTWVVGRPPSPQQQACLQRWLEVMAASREAIRPGATLGDVGRAAVAANGGEAPWLPHFYLAHGLGIESAEMPMIGTDLGPAFDDAFTLTEGMVLVLEPVVWDDGHGGYRAEEVMAVTADGCESLGGDHQYEMVT